MQAEQTPRDEITLQEFNMQIRSVVIFIQSLIQFYFRGLRRYWLLMTALLLLLAIGIGSRYYNKTQVYTNKASFSYTELRRQLYGEMIDKLNDLVQTQSYTQLQKVLPRPIEQLKSITSIKATNIYGSLLSDDPTENDVRLFYITVTATNYNAFDSLDLQLDQYLNSNIAARETMENKKIKYEEALVYRQRQLDNIDTLLHFYTRHPIDSITNMTTTLFATGNHIVEEMSYMRFALKDLRGVKLQEPFLIGEGLPGFSKTKVILIVAVAFFAVSFLLILILSNIGKQHVP